MYYKKNRSFIYTIKNNNNRWIYYVLSVVMLAAIILIAANIVFDKNDDVKETTFEASPDEQDAETGNAADSLTMAEESTSDFQSDEKEIINSLSDWCIWVYPEENLLFVTNSDYTGEPIIKAVSLCSVAEGITSYIDANINGLDTGLVSKENQYTSVNGESVEVANGLFNTAENNDVTTINQLSENDVEVRKIVTKINDEGKYKVDFQVRGKGTKLQVKAPVYVVVVFDNSNSMAPEQDSQGTCTNWKTADELNSDKGRCYDKWDKAIKGAKDFAEIIHNNIPSANIALVSFGGEKDNRNYSDSKLIRGFNASNFSGLNEARSFKIEMPVYEQNAYAGGTNLEAGLRRARQLLSNTNMVPSNALKYVVVMGDG